MNYRIQKYNIFPSNIDDKDSPTYAIESKKHLWNKWKSVYWSEGAIGERVPKLFTNSEALERYYALTKVYCIHCQHCYGLFGEAEWGFRRCKIRRSLDGESDKVVMNNHTACSMFQKRSE